VRESWVIAKREFLERVRTKWFVAMTILGPVLMIALIVVPVLFASRGTVGARIEIVDETSALGDKLARAFALDDQHWVATVVAPNTTDETLLARVRDEEISGFLRVPKTALTGGTITYRGDNATNQVVALTLIKRVSTAVIEQRLDEMQLRTARGERLTSATLSQVLAPPSIEALHTSGDTRGESGAATFFLGYIVALILYMVITLYGINVMRSVVTEKSSRVVELLIAAIKPRALMVGKIAGVGGAGLAQISIWLVIGAFALKHQEAILGAFGVSGAAQSLPSPSWIDFGVIGAFFVLGFLFYSTMYAAVGAMVPSEQDAQQAQMPVTMLLVIGMVSMTAITGDPRGTTAQILTQIPVFSPMLMPLRYLLHGASGVEVLTSVAILAIAIALVSRAAAKIYRIGILMYGKRPSAAELVRWLRY
jgi:ABC-2 type transport system permease protein